MEYSKENASISEKYGIVMGAYCPLARGGKDQKVVLG
jgi:hypothetical protein